MSPQTGRCCKVWKTKLSQMKGSKRKSVRSVDTETVSMEGFTLRDCR